MLLLTVTCDALPRTRLFLVGPLLLRHLVKLVKLPRAELRELGHEYPQVSAEGERVRSSISH